MPFADMLAVLQAQVAACCRLLLSLKGFCGILCHVYNKQLQSMLASHKMADAGVLMLVETWGHLRAVK